MMKHTEFPLTTLETARLTIIPMTQAEFDAALHDPTRPDTFRAAMEELAERLRRDRKSRFSWYTNRLIYRKEDGAYIGSVSYMNSPKKDPDRLGLIEIGYETEEAYRGNGYMTEAVAAICAHALSQPKVYGIIAGVMDDNPASARVLLKCGFTMTDHSESLGLQVWKKIPDGRTPLRWWQRF